MYKYTFRLVMWSEEPAPPANVIEFVRGLADMRKDAGSMQMVIGTDILRASIVEHPEHDADWRATSAYSFQEGIYDPADLQEIHGIITSHDPHAINKSDDDDVFDMINKLINQHE